MTAQYPPVPPGYDPYGSMPPNVGPYGVPYGRPGRLVPNAFGIVLAMVGGLVALVGAILPWYSSAGTEINLGDIVNALDADGAKALPKAYFGWMMWVLLAVVVVAGLFANLPGGLTRVLRVVSPVLAVGGAALVAVSLGQLTTNGSIFDHSTAGLYATLLGFLVAGTGGAFGPRRAF